MTSNGAVLIVDFSRQCRKYSGRIFGYRCTV